MRVSEDKHFFLHPWDAVNGLALPTHCAQIATSPALTGAIVSAMPFCVVLHFPFLFVCVGDCMCMLCVVSCKKKKKKKFHGCFNI